MRLSEAIRAGAKMRPKAIRTLLTDTGSCALGAAGEAVGCLKVGVDSYGELATQFPILLQNVTPPDPCTPKHLLSTIMLNVIWALNDHFDWSREAIAEWVETVENKLEREASLSSGAQDTSAVQAAGLPVSVS